MRFYSDIEKKTIKLILSFHEKENYNCLMNILVDINDPILAPISDVNLFHEKENDTTIEFAQSYLNLNNARHVQLETVSKIYTVINLIKHLIDKEFLIFVKNNETPTYRSSTSGFIVFDILDNNLKRDLFIYDYGYLIPTYSLYQLVENDFKDSETVYEEQRLQWQMEKYNEMQQQFQFTADANQKKMEQTTKKYRRLTIIVSIIAIVVPFLTAIISLCTTQKVSVQPLPIVNYKIVSLPLPFFW